jgi:multidrug efflux system membrane fusion protein
MPAPSTPPTSVRALLSRWPTMAIVLGLALLAVGLFAWRQARTATPPPSTPPPVAVAAMQVRAEAAPAGLEAVGNIQAVRQVMLAPETAGRVAAIRFEPGARVAQGALLLQLDDAPERADRASAVARAELARVQHERARQLLATGFSPRATVDERKAELDQALAAVRQLDARIAQKAVRAPFAGDLGVRRVNPGQYVNPGDPIATLTALDPVYVNFSVPQQELAKLRVGGVVGVASDAWPGRTFTARLTTVEPAIGADTRNIWVQALLANPDRALRPGMYVNARLELPPEPNALLVPVTAIQTTAAGDSIILIRGPQATRGGSAHPVPVETGRRIGNRVVVSKGLKPGDVIVTEGQIRVQPGAKVRVVSGPKTGA